MRKWIFLITQFLVVSSAGCCFAAAPGETGQTGLLKIIVANVRTDHGHVHVAICPPELFLKDNCPYRAIVPAKQGETEVDVTGIPAGTYSVQAYLDENDNDKLDRMLIGVPEEGVGFSGDPSYTFSPPTFQDTAFQFDGVSGEITFHLRYY